MLYKGCVYFIVGILTFMAIAGAVLGIGIEYYELDFGHEINKQIVDNYKGFCLALASIPVSTIIALLISAYTETQKLQDVVNQLRSGNDTLVKDAITQLRAKKRQSKRILSRKDLQNCDLSLIDLSDFIMKNSKFTNSSFVKTNLSNCDLRGSDFSGSNLRGAVLSHTDMRGVNLNQADLRAAFVGNCKFNEKTTLPDGTKYSSQRKLEQFTNPDGADL